jgi:hypothetical protein
MAQEENRRPKTVILSRTGRALLAGSIPWPPECVAPTRTDTIPTRAISCQFSRKQLANFEATPVRGPTLVLIRGRSCPGPTLSGRPYMTEHIVAVFETERAAEAATESLRNAGIPSSAIRRYASSGVDRQAVPTEQTLTHTYHGGFWSWLFGENSTTETTRSNYADNLYDRRASAGNVVVSARAGEFATERRS